METIFKQLLLQHLKKIGITYTNFSKIKLLSRGSINDVYLLSIDSKTKLIVKKNSDLFHKENLKAEASGLKTLKNIIPKNIPKVLNFFSSASFSVLILEWIETTNIPKKKSKESLGRMLASLHQKKYKQYGLAEDNFIGNTLQLGGWNDDWVEFYIEKRIHPQVKLLKNKNLIDQIFIKKIKKLNKSLKQYLNHNPFPSLLHGDLWSGNVIYNVLEKPYLIDPAIYYGDRETDLAMTQLFGEFDRCFYNAYEEAFPLEKGYEDRKDLYNFYHLLNHANIFGTSYLSEVMRILNRYTSVKI